MVPELEYDLDSIGERLRKQIEDGRNFLIAIVAEGTGMSDYLTRWIGDTLKMGCPPDDSRPYPARWLPHRPGPVDGIQICRRRCGITAPW